MDEADGTSRAASGRVPAAARGRLVCPGCGGKMSRGATLCRGCRKAAIVAGVNLLAPGSRAPIPASVGPRTSGQNRAYHGKCGRLAKLQGQPERATKRWALEQASTRFGRAIESSAELNEQEMSDILDLLDDAIAEAEGAP